jgi:hypothetical protein
VKAPKPKSEPIKDFMTMAQVIGKDTLPETSQNNKEQQAMQMQSNVNIIDTDFVNRDWLCRIDPDAEMQANIVNLMADRRPFTVKEIGDVFEFFGDAGDRVKSAHVMLQMNAKGFFKTVSGGNIEMYILKDRLPGMDRPKQPKLFRTPDYFDRDPIGEIKRADGVDMAIFKILLSDGEKRTAQELRALLYPFGFTANEISGKLKTLMLGSSGDVWIERIQRGSDVWYTVKKGWNLARFIKARKGKPSVVYTGDEPELPAAKIDDKQESLTPAVTGRAGTHVSVSEVQAASQEEAVETNQVDLVVTAKDTMDQAIWKVTQDRATYLVSEVAALIEDFGFNKGTVGVRMAKLAEMGWFTRTPEGRAFKYTMVEGTAFPMAQLEVVKPTSQVQSEPAEGNKVETKAQEAIVTTKAGPKVVALDEVQKPRISVTELAQELDVTPTGLMFYIKSRGFTGVLDIDTQLTIEHAAALRVNFNKNDAKEIDMGTVTNLADAVKNDQEQPALFTMIVQIKGVNFSLVELKELTVELDEAISFLTKVKSLDAKITIKTIPLSLDEMKELAERIRELKL